MNKKIIMISGRSASGKSTLIKQIKEEYDCVVLSFGKVHKETVKKSEYTYAKEWIKEEGFDSYEKELLVCFRDNIVSIINTNSDFIIIDGIFSEKCFSFIRNIKSIDAINIVLDTSYTTRIKRMMKRENLNYKDAIQHLNTTDGIKEQAGISKITKDYEYIIDGNRSIEQIKEECFSILDNLGLSISNRKINEIEY